MNTRYLLIIVGLFVAISVNAQSNKKWTLKECVDYALENNISIRQTGLGISDSELQQKSALGNFLPNANATASHVWNKGLTQNITTGILEDQTTQNTSVGASLGVNIFNGLQNLNRLHRANLSLLASQYQLDDMKDNTSLFVANSFLQILFNKESLKVFQSQYAITQQQIERTNGLIESGILPPGDIYEIEATAASQEQQIVNAENAIRLSKIALTQLLQIGNDKDFEIADDTYEIFESEVNSTGPDEIFSKALSTRNDIKISETNVEIAEKDLEIARGGFYPTLSGFYSFNTRASNRDGFDFSTGNITPADPLFDQFDTNKGHGLGLQLNVPIFNRFATDVNVQRNRLNLERSKLDMEQTKVDLESSVYQAHSDAQGALKAYNAAEKTKLARQQAFNYAQERYNVGVINSFEFQQTRQALESAESELIRTKYDYIFKLKILEFYFGIPIAGQ